MRLSKPGFLRAFFGILTLASVNLIAHSQAFGATESILWNFGPGSDGGLDPVAGLIMDASGNLYGTTEDGGAYSGTGTGTVFELTAQGNKSVLWSSGQNNNDGLGLVAGLIMDASGNLYGTAFDGGTGEAGTVFEVTPPSIIGGNWTESTLWNFCRQSACADGRSPVAGLIMDTSGNLYGTTFDGGTYNPGGTVFKLTPPSAVGGNWTESILWNFGHGTDGLFPAAGLIMDTSGNLYGTTEGGGVYHFGDGTVFKLTPPSTNGGNWTESILWSFGNGADGAAPVAGLIMDTSGNLYGTTAGGGVFGSCEDINYGPGCGTVFKLTPPSTIGGNWNESILWNFDDNGTDGHGPQTGLIMDPSGNLYGTTVFGGAYGFGGFGDGTAFKLTPPSAIGGSWSESILLNFGSGAEGRSPSGLIMDPSGNLYGTTGNGGTYGEGTVCKISNLGSGPQIIVKPKGIVFPNTAIGSTAAAKVQVANTGIGPLIGTVNTPSAPFGLSGPGSFTLAPKTAATITLTFTPTSQQQARRIDTVVSNAMNQSTVQLKLEGTGTP